MVRESWQHVGGSLAINEVPPSLASHRARSLADERIGSLTHEALQGVYFPPKSYYLSYTGQGQGKLEPAPPGYAPRAERGSLSSTPAREALAPGQPEPAAPVAAPPIAGFVREADVFCSTAPKAAGVHTATAAECAKLLPAGAYGFQWDCDGKRESKACIVLSSPGYTTRALCLPFDFRASLAATIRADVDWRRCWRSDCRGLRVSGCHTQVYINVTQRVPKPLPSPAPSPGPHWPEGADHPTGELCGSAFFVQLNTKLHAPILGIRAPRNSFWGPITILYTYRE